MIKQSFTLRVLVVSFLVLALPLLVDSFIFFQNSYYDTIKDAKMELREMANFRMFILAEIQPVKQVLLRELDYLLELGESKEKLDSEKMSQKLMEIAHIIGDFQIFILDLGKDDKYTITASSMPAFIDTVFTSYLNLAHIIEAGKGTFVRYIYSQAEEHFIPFVFVARVIQSNTTGKPIGMIMITADIEDQLRSVLAADEKDAHIKFAILNSDGIVFASTDRDLTGKYFDQLSSERRKEIIASNQMGTRPLPLTPVPTIKRDDPLFFEFIFDDQIQIAHRADISDFGMSVVAYCSKEAFFGKAVRYFLLIYSLYGLILVIGSGITYWLSLWISRPLRQLSYLMKEVSQGNLDVRFEKQPLGFEINILGETFNNTLVTLLENIQHAEDERVKKETYRRELAIGRQVQHSLVPSKIPEIKGAEIAGTYLPALEVGGDFYGYIPRFSKSGEEIFVVSVADAAGKGISSCLYALSARSLLRTYASIIDDPGEVLKRTNNAFMEETGDTGMFVTVFTGVYHTDSKILSYYSCGHIPPIVRRTDGHLITLEHSGMALGLKKSKEYISNTIQLQPGDMVIFYTNGLTESVNDQYQPFHKKRLHNCLKQKKWTTAQETVDGLTAELNAFTGGALQAEEAIIVALKVDE